ncbi:hypothetical protein [Umezawaea tangerina]|uniref:Secreted protein n=1 Tax=Umezawaea tangerina TaxID=84725 RepID=A0A2T0SSH7_9PSEU|nr:hypothetical protein [Umezawaea tangerina]PRY36364.1 hypothetical protein CLV43_112292 [Umezawaea tangerina]
MSKRALLSILALIAGFLVAAAPHSDAPDLHSSAVTSLVQAAHLPGATTRSGVAHITPADLAPRVQPPPPLRPLLDAAQRVHRAPETTSTTPLGDRAPPASA